MKKLMRFVTAAATLAGLTWSASPRISAAEMKPELIISVASYNELMSSMEVISKLSGQPDSGKATEGMITMMTGGKGLAGLDKDAPWGLVVENLGQGGMPTVVAFLPLSDVKQQIELLKAMFNLPVEENNGAYEITVPPGIPITVVQRGPWACITNVKSQLDALPDDPAKLLGDLPKKYLYAFQVEMKNLPAQLVESLSEYKNALPYLMQQEPDESDEVYALRLKGVEYLLEQITTTLQDLDQLVIGENVDRQTNQLVVDLELTPKPGSNLAQQAALMKSAKTDFAGFDLPGAALTVHKSLTLTDADAAKHKASLEKVRSVIEEEIKKQELPEKEASLAEALLKDAFDVIIRTVEAKNIDSGAVVQSDEKTLFAAAGMTVADGKKLEDVVKKLAAAAKEEGLEQASQLQLDAETYQGIRFNTFSIPVPKEPVQPLVGESTEIILGLGDTQVYVAAGRDARKTLKEIIDRSKAQAGKETLPLEMTLAVTPLAKCLAVAGDTEQARAAAQKIASALESSAAGKDHVRLTLQPTENGFRMRLTLEEDVFKAIGAMGPATLTPRPGNSQGGGNPFAD
ncbi:MAG: hypothetical protein JXB10_12945 [Pirellulales bacterium]|nr:hypothetical protein [Pirellulales bacterium]